MLRTMLGELYFLQGDGREFRRISEFVQAYIDRFTHKALEHHAAGKPTSHDNGGQYIFLEEISKHIKDPVRLRSELLNILFAGRDTTSSLLSICFHQLARHKDVWYQLRQEILDNVGDRLPTYEDIKNLKFLRYVLNESELTPTHVLTARGTNANRSTSSSPLFNRPPERTGSRRDDNTSSWRWSGREKQGFG